MRGLGVQHWQPRTRTARRSSSLVEATLSGCNPLFKRGHFETGLEVRSSCRYLAIQLWKNEGHLKQRGYNRPFIPLLVIRYPAVPTIT